MNKEIDILLLRYFSGEATDKELRELDVWLSQSQENEDYFNQATCLYQDLSPTQSVFDPNLNAALSQFKKYMQEDSNAPSARILKINRIYKIIAASVAILALGISLFFILRNPIEQPKILISQEESIETKIFENLNISLAPNSQISYAEKTEKHVELSGKATFSIFGKSDKELVISAGETFIKDIGTIFTVTAYNPEELVVVEVSEGEVLFYTDTQLGISIKQYESGEYDPVHKKFTHLQAVKLFQDIVFHAAPLYEVVNELQMCYGVQIDIASEEIQGMHISVSFSPNESIDNVLKIISETLSIKATKNDNTFILSK
ncbi:MAG: DUF4974 domain-containing protein [Bacteroidales bacterium]|jgi:ferric-dicitrate binding protein FerR (iron transport regulator)|nr:DUF4974 domain-containing protein [Bacteroidales bacterium]